MAEQQTIKYAPQWTNMTVDNVIFQTNNVVVVYQNFLREFWSTAVAFDPFPSTDEPEKCPLKEFLIKFLVLNGQRHLTLDFPTFSSSTGLNYNNDKYVDHPTPEAVKKELGKIAINPRQNPSPENLVSRGLENYIHLCDLGEIIYSDLKIENALFVDPMVPDSDDKHDMDELSDGYLEITWSRIY
ncbi:hypothetical protein Tco_0842393 [Tanacetum coccineum]|uniref:Protein kinase domain-containing protein n=1 Tax=Tanacetum coccineum TaxID=301880 RepID=A0ABQ5B018_9ASTR